MSSGWYYFVMSGHSKWANIRRDKAVNDAKRSQIFTKVSRAITVAARKGADPASNPSLRAAIEKAKEARMPKENIEKAIQRGAGGYGGAEFEEVIYEGFGVEGVAFYVKALTDNKNRTVSEIRNIFSKHGGALGAAGSTSYIFVDPTNPIYEVEITEKNKAKSILDLEEALDDHDDVSEVYHNAKIPDNILSEL